MRNKNKKEIAIEIDIIRARFGKEPIDKIKSYEQLLIESKAREARKTITQKTYGERETH